MNGKGFKQEVCRLLKFGIEDPNTRNDAQVKLIIHYRRQSYTENQCFEVIRDWYRAFPHCSREWKSNPERVLKNLKSAVKSFY